MRRQGLMLVELLVVSLIVGLMATAYVSRAHALASDSTATLGVCEANKRNLRAAVEAWVAQHPDSARLPLPDGYRDLREAGLIRQPPHEPGTANLGYTYRTDDAGGIVCRVHDEGVIPPREGVFTRLMVLEVLAFVLILAAYLMWKALRGRNPHSRVPVSVAPPQLARLRSTPADRAARLEVRRFLAELGMRPPPD